LNLLIIGRKIQGDVINHLRIDDFILGGPDKKFMTYSRLDPTGPACPQISSFDFELSIDSEGTISYFTYLIQIDGLVLKIGWQAMRLG
jgi:hypothetical protein